MPYQFHTTSDINEVTDWLIENVGKCIYTNNLNRWSNKELIITGLGKGWRINPYGSATGVHIITIDNEKLYLLAILRWCKQ
jgi:hypothetical protein